MSLEVNREALHSLRQLDQCFGAALKAKIEGARFQRSEDRSHILCEQVRRARHHLQLAIDALQEVPREEADVPVRDQQPPGGWLRERVDGLLGFLTGARPEPAASIGSRAAGTTTADDGAMSARSVIENLHVDARTATLKVSLPSETIELHFLSGELVHAFSHDSPKGLRLGELLVAQGALTEAELASAITQNQNSKRPLGASLARGGWVNEDQLEEALEEQVRALFQRLWTRPDAPFRIEGRLPESTGERAAWNVTQLLMEGGRAA